MVAVTEKHLKNKTPPEGGVDEISAIVQRISLTEFLQFFNSSILIFQNGFFLIYFRVERKMKNRIFILSLFLCITFDVKAEIASGNDCGENCYWSISDSGTLSVFGQNGRIGSFSAIQQDGQTIGTTAPWGSYINQINNIEIKEGIIDLGHYAFGYIESTKPIEIPSTVSSVSSGAFYKVRTPEVVMTNNITEIADSAFNWSFITKVDIPASVTSIGASFRGSGVENVVIPDSVEYISGAAFSACENLKSITIGENTALGTFLTHYKDNNGTATDIANIKIYCMGDTAKCDANLAAAGYENLKSIKVDAKTINGITYIYDKNKNLIATSGVRKNKRIYSIEEAETVSKKKNNVMIRYR